MNFKDRRKDCCLKVTAKACWGESIDEKELERFARSFLRGFLIPKQVKKGKIEYSGPIGAPLSERMKKPISKRDFFFIIEQIVVAVQKLENNSFPLKYLMTDVRLIYMNEITKEVQFVYVPAVIKQSNQDIASLLRSVIYSAIPTEENDSEYISRFVYFLNNLKPFDVQTIEQYIAKEDRSVVNTIKKNAVGQSGFMTNKQQHYYEHYERKNERCDEPTGLLDLEEATDLLKDEQMTDLLEDEATALLNEDECATELLREEDVEETALLNEPSEDVHYPTLFRTLTGEKIIINKPVFRLGKERSYVDYFVTNNVAVSRSHADIITRANRYFVVDLNSKNHTYINGQEILRHTETEIFDGDQLKLGNEEFIFEL